MFKEPLGPAPFLSRPLKLSSFAWTIFMHLLQFIMVWLLAPGLFITILFFLNHFYCFCCGLPWGILVHTVLFPQLHGHTSAPPLGCLRTYIQRYNNVITSQPNHLSASLLLKSGDSSTVEVWIFTGLTVQFDYDSPVNNMNAKWFSMHLWCAASLIFCITAQCLWLCLLFHQLIQTVG